MNWEPSERFDEWPGCRECVHWATGRCVAYPDRIPFPIIAGLVDHMIPRPGQVGDTVFTQTDLERWVQTRERVPARPPATSPTPIPLSSASRRTK